MRQHAIAGAEFSNLDGSPYQSSTYASDAWRVVGNIIMNHHFY